MGDAPLSLDDDDLGLRLLVRPDDLRLQLADHEIALDRVERHPVGRALNESRLSGGHEGRGDSRGGQGVRQEEGRGPLPDRPVRPEHGDPKTRQLPRQVAELLRVPDGARFSRVEEADPVGFRELQELRVFREELMKPGDEVQSALDRLAQDRSVFLRNIATERRHADDEGVRLAPLDRLLQVRDDRDAVRLLVEDLARIASGLRVINHADNRVPFRISDETVRRLPGVLSKITVAEDDGPLHSPESLVITAGGRLLYAIKTTFEGAAPGGWTSSRGGEEAPSPPFRRPPVARGAGPPCV